MAVNEVQAVVDALAGELGRPVEVDDQRFRAIAYSPHADEDIDAVRLQSILQREAPKAATDWLTSLGVQDADPYLRIPGNPALGMVPRVCIPLRFSETLVGYLWLVDVPTPLQEDQVALSVRYGAEMAAELFRQRRLEGVGRFQEAEVVRELVLGGGDIETAVAGWHDSSLATSTYYSCFVVAVVDPAATGNGWAVVPIAAALDAVRRTVVPHHVATTVTDDRGIAILAHDELDEPRRRAEYLQGQLSVHLSGRAGASPVVGVSCAWRSLLDLRRAYREATAALEVASSGARSESVSLADELGAYRVIAGLLGGSREASGWPEALEGLAEAADGEALLETLEAYLERAGDAQATAASIFIHRSSLYNRLHRIETLTGRDLRSGDARLELHLAVRLWRLAGAPPLRHLSSGAARTRDN